MPGRKNPMCNTFPRIASCDYWRWGSGGRQENINAICILGLNHINDKVNYKFYTDSSKGLNRGFFRFSCYFGGGAYLSHLLQFFG